MAASRSSVALVYSRPSDTAAPASVQSPLMKTSGESTEAGLLPTVFDFVARPAQTATIQHLGRGRTLIHPLFATVECIAGEWFGTSADLGLVGRGESEFEALGDLREQVLELFETLLDIRDTLGPELASQLSFLEKLSGER